MRIIGDKCLFAFAIWCGSCVVCLFNLVNGVIKEHRKCRPKQSPCFRLCRRLKLLENLMFDAAVARDFDRRSDPTRPGSATRSMQLGTEKFLNGNSVFFIETRNHADAPRRGDLNGHSILFPA